MSQAMMLPDVLTYLHAGHPRAVGPIHKLDDLDVDTTTITKIELLRGRFDSIFDLACIACRGRSYGYDSWSDDHRRTEGNDRSIN